MKKFYILLFSIFFVQGLSAQKLGEKEVDTLWADQIDYIFEEVDLSRVPHGILLDYAMEFTDVTAYNGTITDSTLVNMDVLSDIYKTLFMGKTSTDTVYFPRLKIIAEKWAGQRLAHNQKQKNTLVLSGLFYRYSKIRKNAVAEGDISILNKQKLADAYVEGKWQNPYETKQTFAIAFPLTSYNKRQFKVVLPYELWLTNSPNSVHKIEVDMGDGNGFRPMSFDQELAVNYAKNGTYYWTFKMTLNDGTNLFSQAGIAVFQTGNTGDTEAHVNGDVANTGAVLRIDYAPGHSQLTKPFIIAEGFDTGAITAPEKEGGDRTLNDDFYDDLNLSGNLKNLLLSGYDLVYIDWLDGTARLEDNSEVLENVLNYVNTHKTGNEQNVLLGQSMGGIIGRYTLARMEQEDDTHDVRLFVSHDAPLQGANTPLAAQFFTRHLLNVYVSAPMLYELGQISLPIGYGLVELVDDVLGGSIPQYVSPQDVLTLQDTPAAVQMNYEWVTPSGNVTSNVHDAWQQEFDNMGYPQNSRNIAISNGNECGEDHGFDAGDPFLDVDDWDNPDFWGDLAQMLYVPGLAIYMNDLELHFLASLPGESKWKYDFDLQSVPLLSSNDRQVYFGRVRYYKKILWFIPSQHTVTEESKDAPPGSLPYASFPGGSYDISDIEDQFDGEDDESFLPPVEYINPNYGFIPVVSALDARRSNQPIDDPMDFKRSYAGGQINYSNLNTQFDNFIVNYNQSSSANAPHISFSVRNGNWLSKELQANPNDPEYPPVANCSFLCDDPGILGNGALCDVSTYTVTNLATEVNWYITEGAEAVDINENGNAVILTKTDDYFKGNITLHVVYGNGKCSTTATRTIRVGEPDIYTMNADGTKNYMGGGATYSLFSGTKTIQVHTDAPNTTFSWEMSDPNTITWGSHGRTASFHTSIVGTYVFTAKATNECGTHMLFFIIRIEDNNGPNYFTVYPNPASGTLHIENSATNPAQNGAGFTLYDFQGNPVQDGSLNETVQLDVSTLSKGHYILKISSGNEIETHHIVVE